MSNADEHGSPGDRSGTAGPGGEAALQRLSHRTLRETVAHLDAVMGIVYFPEEGLQTLVARMIVGTPPAIFSLPERIPADSSHATSRAFRTQHLTVNDEPRFSLADEHAVGLFSYLVAAMPVTHNGDRFGVLTVLSRPSNEGMLPRAAERAWLRERADRLARDLVPFAERGVPLVAGPRPVLVPMYGKNPPTSVSRNTVRGLTDAPGSAVLTLMYQLRKLAAALNRALTTEDITSAAITHIMGTFEAEEMTLSVVNDGRLWVVGHGGRLSESVRRLHGSSVNENSPTADSLRARPVFLQDSTDRRARYPDVPDDGWSSWAYLPLGGSKRPIGVCGLGFGETRRLTDDETFVMVMMADLLGSALERVRMNESEHALAQSLQKRLLPRTVSELPEVTVAARYLPADSSSRAGGDWYDVIKLADDRIAFIVGDVEGHSIESAVVMGQVRTAVLAYACEGHDPSAILERTSKLLNELDTELLATCCVVLLDATTGAATCCLAGHPPPVSRGPDGHIHALDAIPGFPLGMHPVPPYQSYETVIEPGSLLLLYTDGVASGQPADPVTYARQQLSFLGGNFDQNLEEKADRILTTGPGADARHDDAVVLLACYEGARLGRQRRISRLGIQQRDLRGVAAARRFVRSQLRSWDQEEAAEDLELIVSELATNALIHADSDVELRLREFADRIRLEVKDYDTAPPVPSFVVTSEEESQHAEHGRGLVIVDALAAAFGTFPNGRGKTVWLEVATPPAEDPGTED
ncbi:SpoIIE family protein phosphatase [Streptomyces sp. NPDC006923]|uniref:ATP-binding SpoIIE family protein phosphatase n=1 Tax=Streptomyces sp. NPDC006923 TaxID=3155355 RepID=UPI0033E3FDB9